MGPQNVSSSRKTASGQFLLETWMLMESGLRRTFSLCFSFWNECFVLFFVFRLKCWNQASKCEYSLRVAPRENWWTLLFSVLENMIFLLNVSVFPRKSVHLLCTFTRGLPRAVLQDNVSPGSSEWSFVPRISLRQYSLSCSDGDSVPYKAMKKGTWGVGTNCNS